MQCVAGTRRAAILIIGRDTATALREFRAARERFPDVALFADGLLSVGLCTADTALIREGVAAFDPPAPEGAVAALIGAVGAPPGSTERAEWLDEAAASLPGAVRMPSVLLLTALGENEPALRELDRIVAEPADPTFLYYLPFPCLDTIREDPRLQAIIDRLPS